MTTTKQRRAQEPDQGNNLRPTRKPPKAARKSYNTIDAVVLVLVILGVVSLLWGFALSYQVGYSAAESHYMEVNHD